MGKGSGKEGTVCYKCDQPGHIARYCLKDIQCRCCGMMGHKEAKCPVKEFQAKNNGSSKAYVSRADGPAYSAIFGG